MDLIEVVARCSVSGKALHRNMTKCFTCFCSNPVTESHKS
jgi:hypothetical protein